MSTQRFFHGTTFGSSGLIIQLETSMMNSAEQRIKELEASCEKLSYALSVANHVCGCAQIYRDILTDESNEEMSLAAGIKLDNAINTWEQVELLIKQ